MKKRTIDSVSISFDDLNILSATDHHAILKAHYFNDNDGIENATYCILYVSRRIFHEMLDGWLSGKEEYNKKYGYWAGVGNIHVKVKEVPNTEGFIMIYNEKTEEMDKVNVKTFTGISFDVDMEHG